MEKKEDFYGKLEEDIVGAVLDQAVENAKKSIREEKSLTIENTIPLMLKSQYNHLKHLDSHMKFLEEDMATKDDIKNMATKDDIKNMATKDDIKNMATKDDIKDMSTKDDIKRLEMEINNINMRIDNMNIRIDGLSSQINWIKWALGFGMAFISILMTVLKFF